MPMKNDSEQDYLAINKASWNKKAAIHFHSDFYDNESFIQGGSSLNKIETNLLGNVAGKTILHLQCHFGQDTLSLARLGAEVTGVDFSDTAIDKAKELAELTKVSGNFICCDLYDLPVHLNETFDMVFTSYGVISWLPDLERWAAIVSRYLKAGGQFIFVEFHPVVWMFDDDFNKIQYSYFNTGPIIEEATGTYADREAAITQEYVMWNHGICEVVNSLLTAGLEIHSLEEYDYSPCNVFNHAFQTGPKEFRIKHLGNRIPLVYSLVACKKPGSN